MEMILEDIEKALDAELHYAAVALALTLPGICAALEQATGGTDGKDSELYKNGTIKILHRNLSGLATSTVIVCAAA